MPNDKDLKDYLHRMIVPSGFRPQTDEDIERALDLFDQGPMDSGAVANILEKAKGNIPLNYETTKAQFELTEEVDESEQLMALHRAESETESDEVNEKLDKYRHLAKDECDADEEEKEDDD